MTVFTVIGYYVENNQAWAGSFEAEDYEQAEQMAIEDRTTDEWGGEIIVTGVIEGAHTVYGGNADGDC